MVVMLTGLLSMDPRLTGESLPDSAILVEHVSRSFGHVRALDDVSLEVPPGAVFGFLGPNGAGKTTTMHVLLGLLEPDAGSARVLGLDVRTQPREVRARAGALLEFSGLYERMSALDNLDFYGRLFHMSQSDRRARAKELLTHMDLWDRRRERIGQWSRGMKQKLAIARTLFHRPPLVFLDEPTAGLDPVAASALHDDIKNLVAREGVTVFLNTHNLAEAEKLCATVGVIRQGKILAIGNPDTLRRTTGAPEATIVGNGFTEAVTSSIAGMREVASVETENDRMNIRLRHPVSVAPIVRALVMAGCDLEEVRPGQSSLEDVFLTLMQEERE